MSQIIIEFTWLQGSGKTTVFKRIQDHFLQPDIYFFSDPRLATSRFLRYLHRICILLVSPLTILYLMRFVILLGGRKSFMVFWQLSYVFYQLFCTQSKRGYVVYDEFYLHRLYATSLDAEATHELHIDRYVWLFTNIYPIHFSTSYNTHIARTTARQHAWYYYDKLSVYQKKILMQKYWHLSFDIVQKYCDLTNKPYLEVDGDASIEVKTQQVIKHINYILSITWY